jgi:hypothetical protein
MTRDDPDQLSEEWAELDARYWPLLRERGPDDPEVIHLRDRLRELRKWQRVRQKHEANDER